MALYEKHFTLVEANSLIPWVRSIFVKIRRILAQARDEVASRDSLSGISPGNGNGHGNSYDEDLPATPQAAVPLKGLPPWQPELNLKIHHLTSQEKVDLINGLLQKVMEEGIIIREIERGLIDFPAIRQGEEVLLCYEESDGLCISHWHGLEEGFSNRQPLDSDFNETWIEE
jgi:hypothetical protein